MTVTASVDDSVVVLAVDYPDKEARDQLAAKELGRRLCEEYEKHAEAGAPCVVSIVPDVAGSRIVYGIFEAYKVVVQNKGALFLVGYPDEYLASITALGMTTLPHFHMENSVADAVERARREVR
ncbi:hypothetical protein LCGC14_0983320 [marine sediment metagenome]|uniref:STAS domain-containing protein n=1 Tax=marine sediment metagenome TaxID=412755 RepID=A0A0F9REI7_9ZZZZ